MVCTTITVVSTYLNSRCSHRSAERAIERHKSLCPATVLIYLVLFVSTLQPIKFRRVVFQQATRELMLLHDATFCSNMNVILHTNCKVATFNIRCNLPSFFVPDGTSGIQCNVVMSFCLVPLLLLDSMLTIKVLPTPSQSQLPIFLLPSSVPLMSVTRGCYDRPAYCRLLHSTTVRMLRNLFFGNRVCDFLLR